MISVFVACVRYTQKSKTACVIPWHLSAKATTAASVRFVQNIKSAYVIPGHLSANAIKSASFKPFLLWVVTDDVRGNSSHRPLFNLPPSALLLLPLPLPPP